MEPACQLAQGATGGSLSPTPGAHCPSAISQLTMIQRGEGTWDKVWELSEVTDWTPAHHSREKSHGALTV